MKIAGLIIYFWSLPLETQGKLDVKAPSYVNPRKDIGKPAGDIEEQVVIREVRE